ncbi:MAG: hypothetical protein AB1657_04100 [Candidatus Micrarchaeota archaeon]
MSYEECFERGQLRKAQNTREETLEQIRIAESYAKKAEKVNLHGLKAVASS